MSIPVTLADLDGALRQRGPAAYVLTVDERGAPHVVHAELHAHGGHLTAAVGRHTAENARSRPRVSLLYPSRNPADYSLIVDTVAIVDVADDGPRLLLTPARAVLHRPAPAPDPATSPCGSDCIPLLLGSQARPSGPGA